MPRTYGNPWLQLFSWAPPFKYGRAPRLDRGKNTAARCERQNRKRKTRKPVQRRRAKP